MNGARVAAPALAAMLMLASCGDDGRERRRQSLGADRSPAAMMRVADAGSGARSFGGCARCHTIRPGGQRRAGPNLYGIIGAPVARRDPRFGYSAALQNLGGTWTPARMDAWLADPQAVAPGTTMLFGGIADPLERADIIAYLETQR